MSPLPKDSFAGSRRRFGRLKCRGVACSIGEVDDLSAGGMRVHGRTSMRLHEGETIGLHVQGESGPIPLTCRVVWLCKTGWRRWQIGLTFIDTSPRAREALNDLARAVTFQASIRPAESAA